MKCPTCNKTIEHITTDWVWCCWNCIKDKKESGIPWQSINLDMFPFTNDKDTNEQIKKLINDAYKKEQPWIKLPSWEELKKGKKESDNKLSYELDRYFIEAMAKRMDQHKGKYPPYNRQKPMDVQKLKEALNRHNVEIQKGNYDDEDKYDHLSAIACNAMFIYYQLKNHD